MTTTTRRPYTPLTTPISAESAEREPSEARVFKAERPDPTFTIHAALNGFPVDLTFSGPIDHLPKAVARLQQIGATPPPRPSFGGKPPAKPLAQPRYNDAGDPCCTIHSRRNGEPTPLNWVAPKDGRLGFWGCPAKSDGTPGETVNDRGYCSLRFAGDAPVETTNGKVTR